MEIKMKYILGALSLCFIMSLSSADNAPIQTQGKEPLCELRKMFTNETFYSETLYSILHGSSQAVECIAGCLIYTIDRFVGATIKKFAALPYAFIKNCIDEGEKLGSTCPIVGCLMNDVSNGLTMMQSMGMGTRIPFIDLIQKFLKSHKYNQYDVVESAPVQQAAPAQPAAPVQQPAPAQPAAPVQAQAPVQAPPAPANTTTPPPSAANTLASFGIVNFCLAIIISKFIL